MPRKRNTSESTHHLNQQIDRLELEWQKEAAADIASYLKRLKPSDVTLLQDLIGLDLEYRWKRFPSVEDKTTVDQFGFPNFPTIEDYIQLIPDRHQDIFTPEMLAEEYRVRTRWGDLPSKDLFVTRLPDQATEIDAAIGEVDSDLQNEQAGPLSGQDCEDTSQISALQTTVKYAVAPGGSRSSAQDESPRQLLDRYQLETLLGRGGFGEVWRAFDPELNRNVAIKTPRSDRRFPAALIAEFKKEGQRLAQLGPIPGIVTVFDIGECSGNPYIVSEMIEGGSLANHLKKHKLSHSESATLVAAVAEALHRAHQKGLVHRDIKPGNILLKSDGTPVIADFGLAASERDQLAELPGAIGTVAYMPPEQIRGDSHLANPQADIYSLGVVFYQLLTGRLPFVADSVEEYQELILHRPAWPPRSVDDSISIELERICLKCLDKSPCERYSTAGDLASELNRTQALRIRPNLTKYSVVFGGLLIAVLLLLGAIFQPVLSTWTNDSLSDDNGTTADGKIAGATTTEPLPPKSTSQWIKEFGHPTDLVFPGHRGRGSFTFEKDSPDSLVASSDAVRLVQFGNITHSSFTLTIDIRLVDWHGNTGLFFGYRQSNYGGDDCAEFQLLRLSKVEDSGGVGIFLTREKAILSERFRNIRADHAEQSIKVHGSNPQRRIQLEVEEGRLQLVTIDGIPLPGLISPASERVFEVDSFQGPWGGYTQDGTSWFINPKLTNSR